MIIEVQDEEYKGKIGEIIDYGKDCLIVRLYDSNEIIAIKKYRFITRRDD